MDDEQSPIMEYGQIKNNNIEWKKIDPFDSKSMNGGEDQGVRMMLESARQEYLKLYTLKLFDHAQYSGYLNERASTGKFYFRNIDANGFTLSSSIPAAFTRGLETIVGEDNMYLRFERRPDGKYESKTAGVFQLEGTPAESMQALLRMSNEAARIIMRQRILKVAGEYGLVKKEDLSQKKKLRLEIFKTNGQY